MKLDSAKRWADASEHRKSLDEKKIKFTRVNLQTVQHRKIEIEKDSNDFDLHMAKLQTLFRTS